MSNKYKDIQPHKDASTRRHKTMTTTFKSLFNSARQTITGAPEKTPIEKLFPKVDPAVDGEDCDHDCESCVVNLPRGFKIDEEDDLYGFVKGWSTHVLVATGKTDWVRDVADEKGSVMEAIEKKADVKPSTGVCICLQAIGIMLTGACRDSCYLPRMFPLLLTRPIIQILQLFSSYPRLSSSKTSLPNQSIPSSQSSSIKRLQIPHH